MKIAYASDLHLEHARLRGIKIALDPQDADVIILAGDIDSGDRAIKWAEQLPGDAPVVYVAGNHEHYNEDIAANLAGLRRKSNNSDRVHFLEVDQITLKGVNFIGATLWTDYRLTEDGEVPYPYAVATKLAKQFMNDHRLILDRGRPFHPIDAAAHHAVSVGFIDEATRSSNTPNVVITHHAPSGRSVPDRYKGDPLNAAYASNLEHIIPQADLWIHGHMHEPVNYEVKGTPVLANPGGYPGEREAYGLAPFDFAFFELDVPTAQPMSKAGKRLIKSARQAAQGEVLPAHIHQGTTKQ